MEHLQREFVSNTLKMIFFRGSWVLGWQILIQSLWVKLSLGIGKCEQLYDSKCESLHKVGNSRKIGKIKQLHSNTLISFKTK